MTYEGSGRKLNTFKIMSAVYRTVKTSPHAPQTDPARGRLSSAPLLIRLTAGSAG